MVNNSITDIQGNFLFIYIYVLFWRQAVLQWGTSAPEGPGCAGAPELVGWLQSSLHCWPSECEGPQEPSVSEALQGKINKTKKTTKIHFLKSFRTEACRQRLKNILKNKKNSTRSNFGINNTRASKDNKHEDSTTKNQDHCFIFTLL